MKKGFQSQNGLIRLIVKGINGVALVTFQSQNGLIRLCILLQLIIIMQVYFNPKMVLLDSHLYRDCNLYLLHFNPKMVLLDSEEVKVTFFDKVLFQSQNGLIRLLLLVFALTQYILISIPKWSY